MADDLEMSKKRWVGSKEQMQHWHDTGSWGSPPDYTALSANAMAETLHEYHANAPRNETRVTLTVGQYSREYVVHRNFDGMRASDVLTKLAQMARTMEQANDDRQARQAQDAHAPPGYLEKFRRGNFGLPPGMMPARAWDQQQEPVPKERTVPMEWDDPRLSFGGVTVIADAAPLPPGATDGLRPGFPILNGATLELQSKMNAPVFDCIAETLATSCEHCGGQPQKWDTDAKAMVDGGECGHCGAGKT